MQTINEHYENVRRQIRTAALAADRDPDSVQLLAVSKRQPVEAVRALAACGQRAFGENYLQEATAKILKLAPLQLEWHFIGRIQSNKTLAIATHFAWVHGIDRLKIAQRLNDQCPPDRPPLNVCIEVNLSDEADKGGVALDEMPALVNEMAEMQRLRLRGLMALPAPGLDYDAQRATFRRLARAQAAIDRPGFDTLSMGTSDDFAAAIAEGATIVRIGTALFGPRPD
jgi:pyridoxal phosphate enzyme (YggS family)